METTRFKQKEQYQKVLVFINRVIQNREELLAFLAVVINMGLIRKSCLKDYWNLKDWWSQNTPFFPAIFTRDRALLHASVYVTFSGK